MTKGVTDDLYERVHRAARSVAYRWPEVVEADDLEQDMWVRLLESPSYMESLQVMGPSEQDRALKGVGHQIASGERAELEHFTGNFHYSTVEVRKILNRDAAEEPGGLSHTEQADLRVGLKSLNAKSPRKYEVIVMNYHARNPVHGNSQELTRAVDSLTRMMNRSFRSAEANHEGPGSRQVVSNSQALSALSTDSYWGVRL